MLIVFSIVYGQDDFWGLRRISTQYVDTPSIQDLKPVYWVGGNRIWELVEPSENNFDWEPLDDFVNDFVNSNNGVLHYLFEQGFSSWALDADGLVKDFENIPINDPVPDSGYSKILYNTIYQIVAHIATIYDRPLYLNYLNEPWFNNHWNTNSNDVININNYRRCLRTVYKAAHKAGQDHGLEVWVSHGGFNIQQYLPYHWYITYQNSSNREKDSIALEAKSFFNDRSGTKISNFASLASFVNSQQHQDWRSWITRMARETDYLDYIDWHIPNKPRFTKEIMKVHDNLISSDPINGIPKPYFGSESYFVISDNGDTQYEPYLHAQDLMKKYIVGMDNEIITMCPPLHPAGENALTFYGFYDKKDTSETQAIKAYDYLRNLVPNPWQSGMHDLSSGNVYHFRFDSLNMDVLWKDALSDDDASGVSYEIDFFSDYGAASIKDVFGDSVGYINKCKQRLILNQDIKYVFWEAEASDTNSSLSFDLDTLGQSIMLNSQTDTSVFKNLYWTINDDTLEWQESLSIDVDSSGTYVICLIGKYEDELCSTDKKICKNAVFEKENNANSVFPSENLTELYLAPNPFQDEITISLNSNLVNDLIEIQLLNINGVIVKKLEATKTIRMTGLSSLVKGPYLLLVKTTQGQITKRLYKI